MTNRFQDIKDRLGYGLTREDEVWLVEELDRARAAVQITASDVQRAFNQHRRELKAVADYIGSFRSPYVANDQVMLRKMLEALGLQERDSI